MLEPVADRRIHVLLLLISQSVGGAELHTISLANGLDKTKFRVSLAYLKDEVDGSNAVHGLSDEVRVFCANVRRWFDIGALRLLRDYARRESVDIVVCTNRYSLLYGWLLLKLSGLRIPLAEVFHTSEPGTWKAKLQMSLYRPFFQAADLVVFVCETQRTFWRARRLKVALSSVIHNGIDVTRFRNDFPPGELASLRKEVGFAESDFVVGICASLRPEKAHLDLLDALVLLRERGHRIKCMIIGDGPERDRVEHAIDARGLRGDVVVTGYLADVRKYVAACDVMSLVSHYIETFSLSALEAMSLGKPIIMSRVGGAAEQVIHGHNGLLFPAGDIEALAGSILELRATNVDGVIGANARESVVDRFSLDKMILKFEHAFLAMTNRDGVGRPSGRV